MLFKYSTFELEQWLKYFVYGNSLENWKKKTENCLFYVLYFLLYG